MSIAEISERNLQAFTLTIQGLDRKAVAEQMGITTQAVGQHLMRVYTFIREQNPDSPLLKAKQDLEGLIEGAVEVYRGLIKGESAGRPDLRYKASKDVLMNSGLLIPRLSVNTKIETQSELDQIRENAIFEKNLVDQFGLDVKPTDLLEIAKSTEPGKEADADNPTQPESSDTPVATS